MDINRIPFTAVSVPDPCVVFRIFSVFVYREKDNNSFPAVPLIDKGDEHKNVSNASCQLCCQLVCDI